MAEIRRVFLGWDQPLLHTSVRKLAEDSGFAKADATGDRSKQWSLSGWTLVLPVVRAARRLEGLLRDDSARRGVKLTMPRIVTVGRLPELLYQPQFPLAGEMQQTLAWTRALLSLDEQTLAPLLPTVPPREPVGPWVELAGVLRRLCEDLAADEMSPHNVISEVETEGERKRWRLISNLFDGYIRQLARAGFADPFEQRRQATAAKACQVSGPIVLIGCVDLGSSTCKMLESIADDVSLYIGAPPDQQHLFDACGRVAPGRWSDFHVQIDEACLISAGDANAQAAAAVEILNQWRGERSGSVSPISENGEFAEAGVGRIRPRTTVGITDDAFGTVVETELSLCGYESYRSGGTIISRTAPGRLLQRISEFLQSRSWDNFAALARHADVIKHFAGPLETATILSQLDRLRGDHFPVFLSDPWPQAAEQSDQFNAVQEIQANISKWLAPLEQNALALAKWCHPLKQVLEEIYSETYECPYAEEHGRILDETYQLLDYLSQLPEDLDVEVSGHAAVEMILQRLAEPRSLGETGQRAVEISGWLDLSLDDSPEMVVVGLNHPFVPQAVTSDPFLPGNLRTRLSVADNERRLARDLYVLQLVQSTRQRRAFVVGRYGPDGSPTPPSRLLAACPTTVTLQRVRRLLEQPALDPKPKTRWDREAERTELPIPKASDIVIPSEISVTAFRSYLECPYRFYLRHVLGLRPLDDSAAELAANQFGDLVHAAVERFGESKEKDLTNVAEIETSLIDHLHAYAGEVYGNAPVAAVRLQVTQAEKRLKVFAEKQAERRSEGWVIEKAEASVRGKDGAVIQCRDGRKLRLKGRIDRIDFHSSTGMWAILDYKTHGHQPLEKHYDKKTNRWIDLQLPLYLLMLKALRINAPYEQVQVGYFNIPDTPDDCGIHFLDLSDDFRQSAFDAAEAAAEMILDGNFEPQLDPTRVPYDDYSMILQTGAAENLLVGMVGTEDD